MRGHRVVPVPMKARRFQIDALHVGLRGPSRRKDTDCGRGRLDAQPGQRGGRDENRVASASTDWARSWRNGPLMVVGAAGDQRFGVDASTV